MNQRMHEFFAKLLSYPTEEFLQLKLSGFPSSEGTNETVQEKVKVFFHAVQDFSVSDMEELYTRTFDINPVASLEIGWHLYGEAYERGAFLVKMRELLRQHHIEESGELPDHVTHVLLVLGKMDEADAATFSHQYLKPAVVKILEAFNEHPNPYTQILSALRETIDSYTVQGIESHA